MFNANPTGWHHHCACFIAVPAEQLGNLSQVPSDGAEITPGNPTPELAFSHRDTDRNRFWYVYGERYVETRVLLILKLQSCPNPLKKNGTTTLLNGTLSERREQGAQKLC